MTYCNEERNLSPGNWPSGFPREREVIASSLKMVYDLKDITMKDEAEGLGGSLACTKSTKEGHHGICIMKFLYQVYILFKLNDG